MTQHLARVHILLTTTICVISGGRDSSTGFATVEPTTLDVPLVLDQEAELHLRQAHQQALRARFCLRPRTLQIPGGQDSPPPMDFSTVVATALAPSFANPGGRASPSAVVALCFVIPGSQGSAFATVVSTALALSPICAASTRSPSKSPVCAFLSCSWVVCSTQCSPTHSVNSSASTKSSLSCGSAPQRSIPRSIRSFFLAEWARITSTLSLLDRSAIHTAQNSTRRATVCCRPQQSPCQNTHPGRQHWAPYRQRTEGHRAESKTGLSTSTITTLPVPVLTLWHLSPQGLTTCLW